jgi:RNA polymerase sigma-54 factor
VRRKRDPETGYEIEIPESRKYRLRVNSLYQQMVRDVRSGQCDASFREREHLREHLAQARLFINCVKQRWQTLERIALALVDVQEEFLERGYRLLKPLTRSQLADIVGVHESTVGRAVANKSLMLPSGRIVSLSDFFDGSLAIKCVIEEIILEEAQPLSDQRIAEVLQARGCEIARRTVAKYRDAIGVPPARIRAALKNRSWKPLWVPPEHAGSF